MPQKLTCGQLLEADSFHLRPARGPGGGLFLRRDPVPSAVLPVPAAVPEFSFSIPYSQEIKKAPSKGLRERRKGRDEN
jgi:hypothetical protein